MAYRLSLDCPLRDDAAAVADEQLRRAIAELTDPETGAHEAVHQARKRLKKLRGLLRLVRPGLGGRYGAENARFRDLTRRLSGARDARAMIETLDALRERYAATLSVSALAPLRKGLLERLHEIDSESETLEVGVEAALQELNDARRALDDWKLSGDETALLADGARKTYKRARKAFAKAYESPSVEAFHECRKRTKYHWHHARLLEKAWPRAMKARAGLAKRLSDVLGDDHDLAVLQATLDELPARIRAQADLSFAEGLIAQRQRELRAAARPLGERLFAEPPGGFRERLLAYLAAESLEKAA